MRMSAPLVACARERVGFIHMNTARQPADGACFNTSAACRNASATEDMQRNEDRHDVGIGDHVARQLDAGHVFDILVVFVDDVRQLSTADHFLKHPHAHLRRKRFSVSNRAPAAPPEPPPRDPRAAGKDPSHRRRAGGYSVLVGGGGTG